MPRIYLDWNATAPLRREARSAMIAAMDMPGNPSSVHAEGRAAMEIVENARTDVATLVGCEPAEVIFTSGATEAAGVLAHRPAGRAVMVEGTAHDCLLSHLDAGDTPDFPPGHGHVLAMGLADGETGIVSDMPERVDGKWLRGAVRADHLLLDITQAAGRIPLSLGRTGADMAILSAHKLGGPKGVGALILRGDLEIEPLQKGGGQETGRRSGTENLVGIAGFGAAATAALRDLASGVWEEVEKLRNILEKALEESAKDIIIVGKEANRLPNTSCFAVPDWKGETQVMAMDLAGFAVSAGAACSSGKVKSGRVLKAMGYDGRVASSAIRVSLGPATSWDDLKLFADAWGAAYGRRKARAA